MDKTFLKFITLLFGLLLSILTFAGKPYFPVSDIPEELLKNAKAVIRLEENEYNMYSISNGNAKCRRIITVLNESGFENAVFRKNYNKFIKVKNPVATIYDKTGKKIKSISSDEFYDFSLVSGYSLYEDDRIKFYEPESRIYPFTIEYEYSLDFDKGVFMFPPWFPVTDYNIAVEKSVLRIEAPDEMQIRYKELNLQFPVTQVSNKGKIHIECVLENFQVIKDEPFSPPEEKIFPMLIIAPSKFKFSGTEGNMAEWDSYGRWVQHLIKGKNNLSEKSKTRFREMVKNCTNDKEKIETIYDYLQNKMRYVSIQVGMGGWEPFDANTVDEEGYGDCKALTNYMMSALDAVSIKSYYTLAYAGKNNFTVLSDFPSNQFNHVFLSIPVTNDTIWLECTDLKQPCGFLGSFTDDRDVLVLDESGGSLVRTPKYNADQNKIVRKASLNLDNYGDLKTEIETDFIGVASEKGYYLESLTQKEREDYIYNTLGLKDFKITGVEYSETRQRIPVMTQKLSVEVENYLAKVGEDYILILYPFSDYDTPRRIRNRKTEVFIRRAYKEADTLRFKIPEKVEVKDLPEKIAYQTKFGEYSIDFQLLENEVIVKRMFLINEGEYPASDYRLFREFLENIADADKSKCLLIVKS